MTVQRQQPKGFVPYSKEPGPSALQVRLQKTKLCAYHMRGVCTHGEACRFAHSSEELAPTPNLACTRMCPDLLAGKCTNPGCQYAHRLDDIKATNFCYKTTQCKWYANGTCRNGADCKFAHGDEDCKTSAKMDKAGVKARSAKKQNETQQQRPQPRMVEPQDVLEPMMVHASPELSLVDQFQAYQKFLPQPGFVHMPQVRGYPMNDAGYMPPFPPMGAWNMPPMVPGAGYESYETSYNQASSPSPVPPVVGSEMNQMRTLSKHIRSLTKQVKTLQRSVNAQQMRSNSEHSTFSGPASAVCGSSSNEESLETPVVPSDTSSNDQDSPPANAHQAMGMKPYYRHLD